MPRHLPRPHELLRVSEPCSARWVSMAGGERVRFCAHCREHVHHLSEYTPKEALDLVLRSGGRLCLSIERDARGLPRTRDLLDAGAKVNLRDEDGDTAPMSAAGQGRADVVELLLRAGARVNVQIKGGGQR